MYIKRLQKYLYKALIETFKHERKIKYVKINTNTLKCYLTLAHIKKPDYPNRSTNIRINTCLYDKIVEYFVNKSSTFKTSNATFFMQLTQNIQSRLRPTLKGKVKCTLVQALRLCTGRTAHRGGRGIALLFHDQRH